MANYKIITDSACDLPKALLPELDVVTVPLHLLFRGENMPDTVEDAPIADFYAGMRAGDSGKAGKNDQQGGGGAEGEQAGERVHPLVPADRREPRQRRRADVADRPEDVRRSQHDSGQAVGRSRAGRR